MKKRVVIWGLRTNRSSHRFIHQSFYNTFCRLGYNVIWVDDKLQNQGYLEGSNLVISANIASDYIIWKPHNQYVIHNFNKNDFKNKSNVLNLQVFTNDSFGLRIDESIAMFDSKTRTLFQPWGISDVIAEWKAPSVRRNIVEYWIGSIWNNSMNQGNSQVLTQYQKALKSHSIKFRRIGGTKSFHRNGIDPIKALDLVNKSPIGSAIVGDWQRVNRYVPCRLFKNIAAGQPPTSNADFYFLFGDIGYFTNDFLSIIEFVNSLSPKRKFEQVQEAQNKIMPYLYERGIKRILEVL